MGALNIQTTLYNDTIKRASN